MRKSFFLPIRLMGVASNLSAIKSIFFFMFIVFLYGKKLLVFCKLLSFYLFFVSFFLTKTNHHIFSLRAPSGFINHWVYFDLLEFHHHPFSSVDIHLLIDKCRLLLKKGLFSLSLKFWISWLPKFCLYFFQS